MSTCIRLIMLFPLREHVIYRRTKDAVDQLTPVRLNESPRL